MTPLSMPGPVVTFDLFSALLDSRTGGAAALGRLAESSGWPVSGGQLYDAWDPRNKAAQRDCDPWAPWRAPATRAMGEAFDMLGVEADADVGVQTLVDSMPSWPLWPDVVDDLPVLARSHRVGLLSNVDDDLFVRTAASALVDRGVAFTSERLRTYKPHREIYLRALEQAGGSMVHVATSARDVRGALEAEIAVVRMRRPGHGLDPDGPRPVHEVSRIAELLDVIDESVRAWLETRG